MSKRNRFAHGAGVVSRNKPLIITNYWDFAAIEDMTPDVALIVASEYDRIRKTGGAVPRAVELDRWNPSVLQMLRGVGFFELAGVAEETRNVIRGDGWRILRFRSENLASGEKVFELLDDLGLHQIDPALYEAIFEAIVNTRQHAYPESHKFDEPHLPRWWLSGYSNEHDRSVRISVFDQGLSIPGTLHTWEKYPIFVRGWKRLFRSAPDLLDHTQDGNAIRLAMAVGKSSTGLQNRGRGLPKIEAALGLCSSGSLSIHSRNGHYLCRKGYRAQSHNRKIALNGTLIAWDLRL